MIFGPEMNAGHVRHHRAADHDVVEMRDDEVTIGDVNVDPERRQKQAGRPADREQTDRHVDVALEAEQAPLGHLPRGDFVHDRPLSAQSADEVVG